MNTITAFAYFCLTYQLYNLLYKAQVKKCILYHQVFCAWHT
jgi:hypothetical protein